MGEFEMNGRKNTRYLILDLYKMNTFKLTEMSLVDYFLFMKTKMTTTTV